MTGNKTAMAACFSNRKNVLPWYYVNKIKHSVVYFSICRLGLHELKIEQAAWFHGKNIKADGEINVEKLPGRRLPVKRNVRILFAFNDLPSEFMACHEGANFPGVALKSLHIL